MTGLVEDPSGSLTGTARGNTSGSGDSDYYSFSGKAGDQFSIAAEVPGTPGRRRSITGSTALTAGR